MTYELRIGGVWQHHSSLSIRGGDGRMVWSGTVDQLGERLDHRTQADVAPDPICVCGAERCDCAVFQPVMPLPTTEAERRAAIYRKVLRILEQAMSLVQVAANERSDKCEHGIADGEWCKPCNKEYKAARAVGEKTR